MRRLCPCLALLFAVVALHAQEANMTILPEGAVRLSDGGARLSAGSLSLILDATGHIQSLLCTPPGIECLPAGKHPALLSVFIPGKETPLTAAQFDVATHEIALNYGDSGIRATVRFAAKATHMTFELLAVTGGTPERVEWGPVMTTIGQTVGETVAVVRDDKLAIGLQALNIQTIGGAAKTDYGSHLSAVAFEHDGGVKGSKIALFACPAAEALATIGKIEVAEGLPHPMLDGQWGKVSRTARLSYLICPFGEKNLDAVIQYAKQGGFEYIYHPGPFETWGHFRLNPLEFPEGDASMKRCVERAAKSGIRLAVHCLSGFITTNDPYVTPVPDPRLARVGSSTLTGAIDEKATEVPVIAPEAFTKPTPWEKPMRVIIMGTELAQYESVSPTAPWKLRGCKRGVFGTTAAAHRAGADIGKLADHNYNTLYPGIENGMMDEMAARLVELGNKTGLRQISFDGLEGLSAYGYGEYARNRFVKQCYDGWKNETMSDASNLLHYLWHVHSRMNWGEPWGRSMREGMAEYRFANQDYFDRNLYPRMLGWFEVRPAAGDLEAISLEDVEWMLAKAAGYDAGFALTTSEQSLRIDGQSAVILDAVREWERARMGHAFTDAQRERLRAPRGEFHLEATGQESWMLWPLEISKTLGTEAGKAGASCEYTNPFAAQPLRFTLRAVAGKTGERPAAVLDPTKPGAAEARNGGAGAAVPDALANPAFTVNGAIVRFAVTLKPGQYLVGNGDAVAFVYDANWNLVASVRAEGAVPTVAGGKQAIGLQFEAAGETPPTAQVRFKTVGAGEKVGGTHH